MLVVMSDSPRVGDFVVVQRQSYMKIHKLATSGSVKLGKSIVLTDNILGKPYWTTFRMESRRDKKGYFNLVECLPEDDHCQVLMKDFSSGLDNRNILDDGSSQKLSSEEIIGMKDEGLSAKEIVGTLIENSTTFQDKTEYSQEKYLKKKEKKYFEYVIIRKPTIRLIADIMYKQDPNSVMGLRSDTLSQLATAINVHPHGIYILYESGCQSLASAAILSNLSSEGRLILVHPGSNPQKQAILGLNFSEVEQQKLICVNIYTFLRKLLDISSDSGVSDKNSKLENISEDGSQPSFSEENSGVDIPIQENSFSETIEQVNEKETNVIGNNLGTVDKNAPLVDTAGVYFETSCKRKLSEVVNVPVKRPRHEVDSDRAAALIKDRKADGLLVVAKEHPTNILKTFLPYVGLSRNILVYGMMREPLQELSLELRKRPDVVFVQLTEMWLRNFQVLENRTHPCVSMSGGGGYILTGIKVE